MGYIKVVSLDAVGTCIHLAQPLGVIYRKVARRHGVDLEPDQVEAKFPLVLKTMPPLAFAGYSPRQRKRRARAWWQQLVAQVVEAERWDRSRFRRFFHDLYATFAGPDAWRVDADVIPLLERLRQQKIGCICISNADARLYQVFRGLGLDGAFDAIFVSGDLAWAKPDPGIFRHASRVCGVAPQHLLHVGDDLETDYYAALRAGCMALWVCRYATEPQAGVRAIRSLTEIPDWLDTIFRD